MPISMFAKRSRSSDRHCSAYYFIRRIIAVQENTNVPPTQRQEIIEHIGIKTVLLTSTKNCFFSVGLEQNPGNKGDFLLKATEHGGK